MLHVSVFVVMTIAIIGIVLWLCAGILPALMYVALASYMIYDSTTNT